MSRVRELIGRKLVSAPAWLPDNLHYEVVMGSQAYGVSDDASDLDIYGWVIPPKDDIFPHLRGEIAGFGAPRALRATATASYQRRERRRDFGGLRHHGL